MNQRNRTDKNYNLDLFYEDEAQGCYQMPIIKCDDYIPSKLKSFNCAMSNNHYEYGVHFYIDDYQFERVWREPNRYIDRLSKFDCIFSPDFSLYVDMPIAMKIWNVYRSRLIGQYYQSVGIKVIPTISWAEEETYDFCFDGIPQGSIVSVSTIGIKRNKEAYQIWVSGMDEMIRRIKPKTILVYGEKVEYDYKDIEVIYYENETVTRLRNVTKKKEEEK